MRSNALVIVKALRSNSVELENLTTLSKESAALGVVPVLARVACMGGLYTLVVMPELTTLSQLLDDKTVNCVALRAVIKRLVQVWSYCLPRVVFIGALI